MLEYIIIFIFGILIGSFLNVIIYRLPRGESIVFPSSHCPECSSSLQVLDLIPVLSFLLLKGKCRYCGEKISIKYPFVEFLTGFLLISLYHQYRLNTEFIIFSMLVYALVVISFIDYKLKIIPNKITYPGIIIGLILSLFFKHIKFISSLLGILIPSVLFLMIAFIYQKGLGMGDVKLVAMIGTFIGWQYTLMSIFIGSFIAVIIIIILIALNVIDPREQIPFGPFISIGSIITILYGTEIYFLLYIF